MQAKLNYNLTINLTDEEQQAVQKTIKIIKEIINIIDISDRTDFKYFFDDYYDNNICDFLADLANRPDYIKKYIGLFLAETL
jgi:hypothetical protein